MRITHTNKLILLKKVTKTTTNPNLSKNFFFIIHYIGPLIASVDEKNREL